MGFEIGSRVGDYEILAVLGAGGMGQVYKVRNTISDRVEAMKVLLPNLESEPELADRFLREIKVQASLVHPNIAQLHTAARFDNQLLMLMEFVEGQTLEQKLRQGPMGIHQAVDYISQVLSALAYAHSRAVVHRDIKPANMMLMPNGVVKLMDFGIAKAATDRRLTMTGTTMGSLYYMSPEQIQGAADLDARADLYSVGISLYELTTGKRPFDGDSQFAIMSAHLEKQPVPPINLDASLPPALNDIILLSVAKEPAQRFQTADAFRKALQSAGAIGAAVATVPTASMRPAAAPSGSAPATPSNRRGLYIAAGAVAMAIASIAVIQFGPWRSTSANPALSTPQPQVEQPLAATASKPAPSVARSQSAPPVPFEPKKEKPVSARAPSPGAQQSSSAKQVSTVAQAMPPVQQTAPAATNSPAPQSSTPPALQPAVQPPAPVNSAELDQIREALVKLEARAATVRDRAARLQNAQAGMGLGMRGDAVQALNLMNNYMRGATQALNSGDASAARSLMKQAETQVERLEKIFNL
jgi:serine/threonine-protein kinase